MGKNKLIAPEKLLEDAKYKKALIDLFNTYRTDLQDILELATIENAGIRPENLTNEVYSAFHHISRSLNESTSSKKATKELEKAEKSHLKRAILDSYKISINAALEEEATIRNAIEILILDDDFKNILDNAVEKAKKIREVKKVVKESYLRAKRQERKGETDKAIELYRAALASAGELKSIITEFDSNPTFTVALKKVKRKEEQRKKDKRFTLLTIIISCLITGFISIGVSFCTTNNVRIQNPAAIQTSNPVAPTINP